MADRLLFLSWGAPVRGREERSLEVFNASMGLYGRLQQEGRIEGFDVALMTPNAALGATQVTLNVQASDAQSFVKSESQIAAMLSRALARGQRNL